MLTCEYKGNLGNNLFQMWSLLGISYEHGITAILPDHELFKRLESPYEFIGTGFDSYEPLNEAQYDWHGWPLNYDKNQILKGYLQSEKYWSSALPGIRSYFEFKPEFRKTATEKLKQVNDVTSFPNKPWLCISIRRGDFVGNPVYYQTPITYYIGALLTHFPNIDDYNILFVSDDIEYCRVHFECLRNAYFATDCDAYEQLCLASICDHHIISNSTFSWWCAYLANNESGKVIRPKYNFGDEYRKTHPETDYWPDKDNWIVFDDQDYKIPLPDVTFMIPVYYDYPDRRENLNLSVCMLQKDFRLEKEQIIVMENDSNRFGYHDEWAKYVRVNHKYFHRTKMLNDMTLMTDNTIVVNWDADVFIAPMQVWLAVQDIRNGIDFSYPYDGRFARVVRKDGLESNWYKTLCKRLDVGIFRNLTHFGKRGAIMAHSSVGGAVVMSKKAFIDSGLENEYMVSYAPEDCERWDRWHALGYSVTRITGKLYHMDHFCGPNSSSKNPYFDYNHAELHKIRAMTAEQLRVYVDTWPWRRKVLPEYKEPLI